MPFYRPVSRKVCHGCAMKALETEKGLADVIRKPFHCNYLELFRQKLPD